MREESLFDIGIIGGGACGLSVLIQLVEKTPEKPRIAIFEKNDTVGPGLAYSEACRGARINTHAGSMGLSASNPGDFLRWMNENQSNDSGGGMYPYRSFYGRYIQSEMARCTELAREKGIDMQVYNTEVLDVEQKEGDDSWTIQTADDRLTRATKVVVATGNHIRQLNKHLDGRPLYFDRPWPSSRLLEIPKSASVAILGSRLTAIDEALFLVQRGHKGPIHLLSRSRQLPKVQGGSKKYERAYTLYNLARELEDEPNFAMLKIARHIHDEVEGISDDNVEPEHADGFQGEDEIISQFRCDVEMAQKDEVPIFRVLTETGPMSERYWNCLGNMSKKAFLDKYMSTWISYRAAMPLVTGERLLRLLESGQVRVMRTDSSSPISYIENDDHKDGSGDRSGFHIPLKSSADGDETSSITVDALVEATGMEFDISKIDTPLMQNLVRRELITPHLAGGVDVDFRTLRARSRHLYCLGSLTRGVHFHTTTLDRSVVHAEWVADDILGLPPRKFLHVALFVGSDLFSQLVVGQLVPRLLGAGHVPFVYAVKGVGAAGGAAGRKRRPTFEMRERHFYETSLLQDTVVPYFESRAAGQQPGQCLTLRQLRQRYGILVQSVSDFDDPQLIADLDANHVDIGYGIRCPQALGADGLLHAFEQRQGLFALQADKSSSACMRGKNGRVRGKGEDGARACYNMLDVQRRQGSAETVTAAAAAAAAADIPTHMIDYAKALHGSVESIWDDAVETMFKHAEEKSRGRVSEAAALTSTTIANANANDDQPTSSTDATAQQNGTSSTTRTAQTNTFSSASSASPNGRTPGLRLSDKEGIKKILVDAFTPAPAVAAGDSAGAGAGNDSDSNTGTGAGGDSGDSDNDSGIGSDSSTGDDDDDDGDDHNNDKKREEEAHKDALKRAIDEACRAHRERTITQGVCAVLRREQDLGAVAAPPPPPPPPMAHGNATAAGREGGLDGVQQAAAVAVKVGNKV